MYIVVHTNKTIHFIHIDKNDVERDIIDLVNDCRLRGLEVQRVYFAKEILTNW